MAENYVLRAHKQLQIESWSNAARTILLRGYSKDGPFAEQHTTNADRSRAVDTYEVHGDPLSVTASPLTAPVRRGECYLRVTLLLDGEPVKRLMAAYLTDGKTLTWPPGVHEAMTAIPGNDIVILGTNPAAGVEIIEAVPVNTRRRIKVMRFTLGTDGTVVNRYVITTIDDGVTTFYDHIAPVQIASQTMIYNPTRGMGYEETAFDANNKVRIPIPDIPLSQGWRIRTATLNLQAGDDFSAPLTELEEWIEE